MYMYPYDQFNPILHAISIAFSMPYSLRDIEDAICYLELVYAAKTCLMFPLVKGKSYILNSEALQILIFDIC